MDTLDAEIKSSTTFQQADMSESDILKQIRDFHTKHNLSVDNSSVKLPFLYLTAKFHKSPYGCRYSLKLLLKYARRSPSSKFKDASNIDNISIVDNRSPVIEAMKHLNKSHRGYKSVRSYDFSTLYTSIPHDQIKAKMRTFVENIFNCQNERKPFIVINGK